MDLKTFGERVRSSASDADVEKDFFEVVPSVTDNLRSFIDILSMYRPKLLKKIRKKYPDLPAA